MALKTVWTDERLRLLFKYYNEKYWQGRLPRFTLRDVKQEPNQEWVGCCNLKRRQIKVVVCSHRKDSDIRKTVLHEMCHAAAGRDVVAHGYKFFAQVEMLLRKRAPLSLDLPETPGHHYVLTGIIPRRFPLARKKFERLHLIQQKAVKRLTSGKEIVEVSAGMLENEFSDAALTVTWKIALFAIAAPYGLVDIAGKPIGRNAALLLRRAKKAFDRSRRDHLEGGEPRTSS